MSVRSVYVPVNLLSFLFSWHAVKTERMCLSVRSRFVDYYLANVNYIRNAKRDLGLFWHVAASILIDGVTSFHQATF